MDRRMMESFGLIRPRCGPGPYQQRIRRSADEAFKNTSQLFEDNGFNESGDYISGESEYDPCPYFLLDPALKFVVPVILTMGLVGNLLSCLVFLNTHLRLRSSSYYLAALATADFGFLLSLLCVWLNDQVGWQIISTDGWCESVVYVSSACGSLSVWLIVAFTVERFIAVQYPLHRPNMCTISRAKTIVCCLTLAALICHSYALVMSGMVKSKYHGDAPVCDMKAEYAEAMKIISFVDTLASLLVPLVLIVTMNAAIMRQLYKFSSMFGSSPDRATTRFPSPSKDRSDINLNRIPAASSSSKSEKDGVLEAGLNGRKQPSQQSFHSTKSNHSHNSRSLQSQQTQQAAMTATAPTPVRNTYQLPEINLRCIHVRATSRNPVSIRNQLSITKMLLLISTVFVLLNLPSYVVRLCVFYYTLTRSEAPVLLWCLQQFFMLLYYTNFSINFLLYAMCGATFRKCLEQLLQKFFKSLTSYHCNDERFS